MLKSTNGWLALGKGKSCQNQEIYMWCGLVFSWMSNLIKKTASTYPCRVKWLNKGCVSKCHSYYHFYYEGRRNEELQHSYYACTENRISCIPHVGIFHEQPEDQLETSRFHKFINVHQFLLSEPIFYKY